MVRDKSERLVNLTTALLDSPRPLTFDDIRQRLRGTYDQDDPETARRMFERDKKELRGLNIPVTTSRDFFTEVEGYTIDREAYELPAIDLTVEEASALLAGVAMSGGADERIAAARLTTDVTDPVAPTGTGGLALALDGEHLDAVAAAVATRTTVTFDYRAGSGTASTRTLDPWSVGVRNGIGYVLGHDHDRDDHRVFRLSRITSRVRTMGEPGAFERPDDVDLAAELAAPIGDGTTVHVVVDPGAVTEVLARGGRPADDADLDPDPDGADPDGADPDAADPGDAWQPMVLDDVDPVRLTGWLLTRADRVVVTAPDDLRTAIRDHLAATAAHVGAGA